MSVVPLVLAGGDGARLWPLSRADRPKPFLDLLGHGSPLDAALSACRTVGTAPIVVAQAPHRFLVAEAARRVGLKPVVLLEPTSRGAGLAVLAGAVRALVSRSDAVLVLMPTQGAGAPQPDRLRDAVGRAADGAWVLFAGEGLHLEVVAARTVLDRARSVAGGGLAACVAGVERCVADRVADLDFERLPSDWGALPSMGLDVLRGPIERVHGQPAVSAGNVADLDDLHRALGPDADGNVARGRVALREVSDSLVVAEDRLVAAHDVDGLIVVETRDAVLVTRRRSARDLRALVAQLRAAGHAEASTQRRVLRPWGSFEPLAQGPRWKVKRILVEVGHALSLQRHAHRAEHWVVVRGRARITCGQECFDLGEQASTFIPRGVVHRLENIGSVALEIIEVQTGDRVDEDDIERLEDRYGRSTGA